MPHSKQGSHLLLTGPLFPTGKKKETYLYDLFLVVRQRYYTHINIGSSAPDWPGTFQKYANTSTTLKEVGR